MGVTMDAQVGESVVEAIRTGGPARKVEVLAVPGTAGRRQCVVRWDDTRHETPRFPSPTSWVLHTHRHLAPERRP